MQEVTSDPVAKKALIFISSGSAIGRALIAPPDLPNERLVALRAAFDAMVKYPAFLADSQKRNVYLDPTPGAQVQEDSNEIVKTPKDIVDRVAKVFKE